MDDPFKSFCTSVGLEDSQSQAVADMNPKQRLELSCSAVQSCIGTENVGVAPLNQAVINENWSQSCVAQPYCVVQPADAKHVGQVVKIIKYFGVKFAVRSGGHSPNPGWSALALDAEGTSVIGGRIPAVGVGGLILGGEFFHFSGEFGMAADNVKNFEIVLADGNITNANTNENTDLFWALKGGGSNFGIVTRYDLYTIPVRDIWYRWDMYAVDQAPAVLDAMVKWQNEGASDLKSTVALIIGLDGVVVGLIYSAPANQPSAFAPFHELPTPVAAIVPPLNGTVKTLTDFLSNTFSDQPLRHDYRGVSTRIDGQLYQDVYKLWRQRALATREATGANQTFTIQPIPKNLAEQGIAKGGNPMGIPQEDHQWWTTVVDWANASDDDAVRSVSIDTTEVWNTLARERGLDLPFIFANDASRDQNPLASYGKENVSKLKQVSLKYDESQFFQKQQNGGFLPSKV
ncbi:FAD-binding domain-containing protein [Hypoxylon trugodes]|uniref:FAD-binding domain-containing protein n=1 Tax=Hypoxylon trugodes TaxID=326681 RepID=UPI00219C67C4|nr:FAD-binding domain-containing protein [Hypoxylon trugodes]KAI1392017.1 FAD-binding domain-containing protein [Hypoxylon trugodes]